MLVGRDLQEGERLQRLLPAWVRLAPSPQAAREEMAAQGAPDVVLLEDRAWSRADEAALEELQSLSSARKLALILSRRRGEHGEASVPVVERPYRIDEIVEAMRLVLLRRRS
jgi:hypothetical protein